MDTYLEAAASEIDTVKSAFGLSDDSKLVLGMCTTIDNRRGTPDDDKSVAIVNAHPGAAGVFVWTAEESAKAGYSLEKRLFEAYSSMGGNGGDGSSGSDCTYTIQPDDTLSKIADAKGTTTDAIESVNPGIDPLSLQIGEVSKSRMVLAGTMAAPTASLHALPFECPPASPRLCTEASCKVMRSLYALPPDHSFLLCPPCRRSSCHAVAAATVAITAVAAPLTLAAPTPFSLMTLCPRLLMPRAPPRMILSPSTLASTP